MCIFVPSRWLLEHPTVVAVLSDLLPKLHECRKVLGGENGKLPFWRVECSSLKEWDSVQGSLRQRDIVLMAAVLSTDLLMQVLVSLSNLQTAQPGQRSGFCGACSDVYDAVERTLLFCGPFYSRKWFIKALSLSVIFTLDETSFYSSKRICEVQSCHSLLVLKCRVSS